jgi:hypothetical protein
LKQDQIIDQIFSFAFIGNAHDTSNKETMSEMSEIYKNQNSQTIQAACKYYFEGEEYWGKYLKRKLPPENYENLLKLFEELEAKRAQQTEELYKELAVRVEGELFNMNSGSISGF